MEMGSHPRSCNGPHFRAARYFHTWASNRRIVLFSGSDLWFSVPSANLQKQKTPPVLADRGRQIRGTTSGSGVPHGRPLTASDNAICCIGHTRPALLRFYAFGLAAPGGISAVLLTALHRPAALWKKGSRLLHPIHAFLMKLWVS